MAKSCSVCGSPFQTQVLPDFIGKAGSVTITFEGVSALSCPQGHERKMMNAEFPAFVLEDVLKTLPQSRAKGLVNKQHLCSKCNTVLNIENLENGEFQIPMSLKSMQPFRIGISGPVAKCSACMTLQMVKTRQLENADIPNAMVSAFDRIGLKR